MDYCHIHWYLKERVQCIAKNYMVFHIDLVWVLSTSGGRYGTCKLFLLSWIPLHYYMKSMIMYIFRQTNEQTWLVYIALILTVSTMKLWHWKSHWKSRPMLKNLGTKEMSNAENFSMWFKNFQCDFSVLEQQRNIFECDYPGLSKYFSVSVTKIFSVIFSVINS